MARNRRRSRADRTVADALLPQQSRRSVRHVPRLPLCETAAAGLCVGPVRVFVEPDHGRLFQRERFLDSRKRHRPLRQLRRGNPGGAGTTVFSSSVGKTFAISERVGVRYEAQFANLFNLLNKAAPNMNVASSSFGLISQSQLVEQGRTSLDTDDAAVSVLAGYSLLRDGGQLGFSNQRRPPLFYQLVHLDKCLKEKYDSLPPILYQHSIRQPGSRAAGRPAGRAAGTAADFDRRHAAGLHSPRRTHTASRSLTCVVFSPRAPMQRRPRRTAHGDLSEPHHHTHRRLARQARHFQQSYLRSGGD